MLLCAATLPDAPVRCNAPDPAPATFLDAATLLQHSRTLQLLLHDPAMLLPGPARIAATVALQKPMPLYSRNCNAAIGASCLPQRSCNAKVPGQKKVMGGQFLRRSDQ